MTAFRGRRKRVLFTVIGGAGMLALALFAVFLPVTVNRYKPRLQAAASDAVGMDVRIGDRIGVGLFPGLHVTLKHGRILDDRGAIVASAERTILWVHLLPLLRGEFRLRKIDVKEPTLSIERDSQARLNVERLKRAITLLGALDGASLSLSDGTVVYTDLRSGMRFEATGFELAVKRMRLAGGNRSRLPKDLSLEARMACREFRTKNLAVSALTASIEGEEGRFMIEPIALGIFGGQATGSLRVDLSGPVPACELSCSLPHFRVEEFLQLLSPQRAAEGAMDFSARLTMQGGTAGQLVQTAAGQISLRGTQLMLVGNDLDQALSRFDSSQNFNLVDVGAVFFAGPLGLAVTKGYSFASLFQGSGGNSRIETLVSDWTVERGIAQAEDVAMATTLNRIALRGGLDFVHQRFADVTVAVIDARGCARLKQAMRGSFAKPVVEKPRILSSLAGPVLKLYQRARGVFPAGPCEVFYSGTVAQPI